jgi:uncharacterized cupredoxin-like copper-binding protein
VKTFMRRSRIASVLVTVAALALAGLGGSASAATAPAISVGGGVTIVNATLSDGMHISLDRYSVPAGTVRFLVTNAGQTTHELVVLKTDLPADQLVADPDEAGKVEEQVHMGETGDIAGGRFSGLELQLGPGNYVIICNELGHYMAGMRIAFTVYQPFVNVSLDDHMTITLDRTTIYAGPIVFAVSNRGEVIHEFVVLQTSTSPDAMQPDPDEAGKIIEEANIGEIDGVPAGRFSGLALDLAPGTYLLICNEPGHFAAGMYVQFTVLASPGGDE